MKDKSIYYKITIWSGCLFSALIALIIYSNGPGKKSASMPTHWPLDSKIEQSRLASALIFLHPHCPCSMATLNELERLLPYIKDKIQVSLIFTNHSPESADWFKGRLYNKTQGLSNVKIIIDENLYETSLFQAKTSGHFYLYENNVLKMEGGLTPSRGHEGENLLQKYILAWINKQDSKPTSVDVYGCDLNNKIAERSNL